MAVDGDGNLHIADTTGDEVAVIAPDTADGAVAVAIRTYNLPTGITSPRGFAVDGDGNLHVADTSGDEAAVFAPNTANGAVAVAIRTYDLPASTSIPSGLTIDGDGNIHVSDSNDDNIRVYAPDVADGGTAVALRTYDLPTGLNNPEGLTTDRDGNIHVADISNDNVVVIAPDTADGARAVAIRTYDLPTGITAPQGLAFVAGSEDTGTTDPLSFGSEAIDDQAWAVGTAESVTLPEATGGEGTITYSLSTTLPDGVTFTAGTRVLAGTPTAVFTSATFTYTATDEDSNTVELTFTIVVAAAPDAVLNITIDQTSVENSEVVNVTFTFDSAVTGFTAGDVVVTFGATKGVLTNEGNNVYTMPITAPSTGSGTIVVRVAVDRVSPGNNTDSVSFTYATPVVALSFGSTISNQAWTVGTAESLTLPEATGGNGAITYSLSPTTPAGITFTAATRVLAGTPTGRFTSTTFTYTAEDADGTTVDLTFTIVVTATAITFNPTSFANQSWTVGTAVALTLPDGAGGVGDLTPSLSPTLPTGVTFTASTRALAGNPTGTFTSATFTYTMTDAEGESESITFTIVVNAETLVATTVVEVSGDDQSSQVSTALSAPFIVEVRDQNGDGLSGVTVAFAVTAGGGTLSASSVTTDSSGQAESTLTLGSSTGTNTVTATVSGITAITFTATGTAEDLVATTLDRISGSDQTATVSTVLDDPFVVEVQDQNGDVLSGATVAFAVTIGNGTLSDTSVTTDSNGRAESTLTLGSTAGSNRAVASVSGITQTRNFNATGTAVVLTATALAEVSGDDQSAVVSTELSDPFVVQVNDQNGDAFSGADVTFAVASGGGTLSETSVTTGADGQAETTLTLGSAAGENTVTADVSGISTTIIFTATATAEALVATSIVRVSGNNQTGTVGKELDNPFVVEVRDQNGDGLSGITVAFAVTAGGGTLSSSSVTTGSNGQASSTLTVGSTAGTNTVRATAAGITTTRTFTATGEATVATTIVSISGDNRTATVSTTLSTPFVVEVRDQDGDGLSGVTVAFAVAAGGGTLSASSVTTDASGRAESTLTLGSAVGTNTVTATASGITGSITFTATASAEVFPLTVSVTVPATAELGETVDISATVTGEDSIEWKTTGGSIDDSGATATELTVPSESGVIAVTCIATDVDGATASDTAYVTVGDPAVHIYTPAVRIEIEGVDVTDRRIPRDGMTVGKSLDYPELLTFRSSGLQFNLDNADGMFDYSDPNNFFVSHSRPAHGRGAQVLVEVGLSQSTLIPVFAGQISSVETSLVNTKARIKVRDISVNLRQNT